LLIVGTSAYEATTQEIPVADIIAKHGVLYEDRSADEGFRIGDLNSFPLLDGQDTEIPIYNRRGKRVARRQFIVQNDTEHCGLLLNLKDVHELFNYDGDILVNESDMFIRDSTIHKYSMGYLHDIGQLQTRQPIPLYASQLQAINESVAQRVEVADAEYVIGDDDLPEMAQGAAKTAVFGTASQIYNSFLHFMAPFANEFIIQQGCVTAAYSGQWADKPNLQLKREKACNHIKFNLPHEQLRNAINSGNGTPDLRVEQVYVIHMDELLPEHKNGQYVA
jgi:hypothetical protein